ncbi:MAG TPA: aminotransferase class V-fold PLP-dependent enzyme, partial [Acidimicrobiales bacterium]|nr:aminotransferase class V-fold PLP-dependent enzyme [Acidimicrobiales bacterium]
MAALSPSPAPYRPMPVDLLDVATIRAEFPIFERCRHRPLVYLDSAASSQKPRAVIEAMAGYYESGHANVHRGVYALAEEATTRYEAARAAVGR